MANAVRTEVEQLQRRSDVRKELKHAAPPTAATAQAENKSHLWMLVYALVLLGLIGLELSWRAGLLGWHSEMPERVFLVAIGLVILSAIVKMFDTFLIDRLASPVSRFNLRRILRLLIAIIATCLVASVIFHNWYTAFVSLGLISLILGFALQTPITSLIGWIYILVRTPYRVGDRIKIGDATGVVIDVSYIDTTLWEFGGDLLSTDHPSGRIIKFPNSRVLSNEVYNYTWPLFPYVWNEIKFSVAYESDLEYVAETMRRVAEKEVGENMAQQVQAFRQILAQTPVDQLEVREHPAVLFRTNSNTWLDAIVRYLVHPKEAGRVKSRMITKLLKELTAEPDKVLFPKSNAR